MTRSFSEFVHVDDRGHLRVDGRAAADLADEAMVLDELKTVPAAGGQSIIDPTCTGLRPDPSGVRRLSEAAGVHVVMGCGWYRQPYYPAEALIDRTSTEVLTERLLYEIEHGVCGTDVLPGIIAEVGSNTTTHSPASPVGPRGNRRGVATRHQR